MAAPQESGPSNGLGYVPYQRKTHARNASTLSQLSQSSTSAATPTGQQVAGNGRSDVPTAAPAAAAGGFSRPSTTPIGVGMGSWTLMAPPPPLRSASNLRTVTPSKPAGKQPEVPSPTRQLSASLNERKKEKKAEAQPQPRRVASPRPSSRAETNGASSKSSSPFTSGSSTPLAVPAHVHSYAALLAAQAKLDPIPVPHGVAIPPPSGAQRLTAYRPGFQPKGAYNVRTDEFTALRRKRRADGEMEEQRMERRLAKLIAVHFTDDEPSKEMSALAIDLDELRSDPRGVLRKSGENLWGSLRARSKGQDPGKRAAEQAIVKWQDDAEAKRCPICDTQFSLTVRKHHCRLCGRVVCASPHLSKPNFANEAESDEEKKRMLELKCSNNIVGDPTTGRIRDASPTEQEKGVRICRDCKGIIHKRQYMLDDEPTPVFIKLYDALMRVQKEIQDSLPEFQELLIGLQKQDDTAALGSSVKADLALQRDAAKARKQLLANFANYDELAKRIRKLPTESSGDAQDRIQQAIFTRANLFLQQNMLPLRSLPKPEDKKKKKDHKVAGSISSMASFNDWLEDGAPPGDPSEIKEQLAVLYDQERQVAEYAEQAQKARKFDDARTLKKSHEDLCREIMRLQKSLARSE